MADVRISDEREQVAIRPYENHDRAECVAMSVEAWHRMSSGLPGGTAGHFWGMLVDIARDYSDLHEVACVSDSVVGFLFGRRRGPPSTRETMSQVKIFLRGMHAISRESSAIRTASLLCTLVLAEIKVLFNSPKCDGEVAFLVVGPRHQGRGIGNLLLDSYIAQARSSNVRTISVYTTDPGCNWGFYEGRGFRRVAQFGDDFGTRLEGEGSKGLMYVLDLDELEP
jgi:GNAT superfamily N-acetyltransferase